MAAFDDARACGAPDDFAVYVHAADHAGIDLGEGFIVGLAQG